MLCYFVQAIQDLLKEKQNPLQKCSSGHSSLPNVFPQTSQLQSAPGTQLQPAHSRPPPHPSLPA